MPHTLMCQKLKKEAEALSFAPYPGALGQKILETISAPAWQEWVNHQTMLINEYRLNLTDPKARTFLKTEMEKFLFGTGTENPTCFVPEK